MSKKFYVSSKLKHRDMWLESGLDITSSWINSDKKLENPIEIALMWKKYLQEVEDADEFILYYENGEIIKGSILEVGAAMILEKPINIIYAGVPSTMEASVGTWIYHSSVKWFPNMESFKERVK